MRDPAGFEMLYAGDPDPWDFRTSPYEQCRYDAIVAGLSRDRYARAFEPACSIGELTLRLAQRCDHVDAIDLSPTAVSQARQHCREAGLGDDQVSVEVGSVVDYGRTGYDLVVFSELGYYFQIDVLATLVDHLLHALRPGGELLACHWLGNSADHRLHGNDVHDVIGSRPGLEPIGGQIHQGFRIESWTTTVPDR